MNTKDRVSEAAFSLIEVTVVLAVVAVVAAILTTTVIQARQGSRTMVCAHNLRQISTGIMMYHHEYKSVPTALTPLPGALGEFLADPKVFVCPSTPFPTMDSYSAHYVPHVPDRADAYLLGCSNHVTEKAALASYAGGSSLKGKRCAVTWDGQEVQPGAQVTGGTLTFADGTRVTIQAGVRVIVLTSFEESVGRIYSAVRLPVGVNGSVDVEAAHGTHFDVVTPACTAGVRGTRFRVTVSDTTAKYATTTSVQEGVVCVEAFWPRPKDQFVHPGETVACELPKPQALEVMGPFFWGNNAYYNIRNASEEPVTLYSLQVTWPQMNKRLDLVMLHKSVIAMPKMVYSQVTTITNWTAPASCRTIEPGTTGTLMFGYLKMANTNPDLYSLSIGTQPNSSGSFTR